VSSLEKFENPAELSQWVDPERLPVQLIAPTSGRLRWLLDRAAAADLEGGA
jgi:hypothetical protein